MKDRELLHICLDFCSTHDIDRTDLSKNDFRKLRAIYELSESNVTEGKFKNLRNLLLKGTEAQLRKVEDDNLSIFTALYGKNASIKRDPEQIISDLLWCIDSETGDIEIMMKCIHNLNNASLINEVEYRKYINILEKKSADGRDLFYAGKVGLLEKYDLYYNSSDKKIRKIVE